jgi:DNA-binding transcriptional LysR family regulator
MGIVHFSITDLALFVRVAELGNLTKGAQRASLSPAAASARIKSLETQLNSRLFYRDSRGVSLTLSGETLLHHARAILRQVDRVKSEFAWSSTDNPDSTQTAEVGHLRLFANTTAVTEFLPKLLARFMVEYPGVTMELQERGTHDVVRSVLDDYADIGIVAGPVPTEGLHAWCFSKDRLVLVTPKNHPLSHRSVIAFSDALEYHHICMNVGHTLQTFLMDKVRQLGRELTIRVQIRSFEAMCRMIEAGVGVGLMPESSALNHQKSMQLDILELTDSWAIRERKILVRELGTLPRYARALINAVLALELPVSA